MINNGGGGFSSGQLLNVNPNPPEQVALADLDVDGDLDLVLVDRQNSRIRPYLGNGLGTFTATTVQTVNQQPRDVAVADLNKDGDPDLVTANSGTTQVTVLLGAAGATFTRTDYSVGLQTHAVGIGDLDGDGNLDIVAASQFNNRFARILGNGLGGFGSASNFLSGGTGPADLLVSDFDADGNLDVAVVHLNTSNLGISLGNGNGTFQAATSYASGATMGAAMVAGDIDLSGRQDLLLTFAGSGNVAVFRETTPTPGGLVAFGTGTGGCEGRLGINASEAPRINRPNFHLLTSNGPPHDAVAAFFTGNADPGTLVYGALFHVSFTGLVSYPTVSDEAGYASYNLPIPNNPALLGLSLSFQGVFIEPVANRCSPSSLGIVTSVGMTATIF